MLCLIGFALTSHSNTLTADEGQANTAIIQWTWTMGSPSADVVDANATPKKYTFLSKGNVRYLQTLTITKVEFVYYAYNAGTGGYDTSAAATQTATLGAAANEGGNTGYANRSVEWTLMKDDNTGTLQLSAGNKYKIIARISSKLANDTGNVTVSDFEPAGFVEAGK